MGVESWQAVKESTAYWPGLDMEKVERHLAELKESEANEAPNARGELWRNFGGGEVCKKQGDGFFDHIISN